MIQIVIGNLKNIKNPTSDKLVSIFNGTQETVAEDYYATTVFETQKKYDTIMSVFDGKACGLCNHSLVETPLIFVHSKFPCVLPSKQGQGIAFGVTLIDYISKTPYIVIVCNKSGAKYELKTLAYDLKTKTYKEGSSTKSCDSTDKVFEFFQSSLSELINKFKTK